MLRLKLKCGVVGRAFGICGALLIVAFAVGCGGGGGGGGGSGSGTVTGSGGLWVPNYFSKSVVEFTPSQLQKSGAPSPKLTNRSADLNNPTAVVFDKNNNLWVSNYYYSSPGSGTVVEYTLGQLKNLASNSTPTAPVVISGLSQPVGLAFDNSGDLWVAQYYALDLVEFTPSQLATGGTVGVNLTPAITIKSSSFKSPAFLAFDKSGDLWMSDAYSTADATGSFGEIFEFTPSQFAAGGSLTLTPNISLATKTLQAPYGLVFDGSGNLWVANSAKSSNTVQEFAAADLTGSGVIQPAAKVTLGATTVTGSTSTANSLDFPRGIGFDGSGNLWVSNGNSDVAGSLAEFTPSQFATTGTPSPTVFIDSNSSRTNINSPFQFAFGPSIN